MGMNISKNGVKERLHEIQQKLEVSPDELDTLKDVIKNDIYGLSVILMSEGYTRKIKEQNLKIATEFLKNYANGDYNIFKKYYKKPLSEWDFLTKEQKIC